MDCNSISSKLTLIQKKLPQNIVNNITTCFFGPTGAGKSSLIAYLLAPSQMQFTKKGMKFALSHNSHHLPPIGNLHASSTQLPALYSQGQIHLLDLPGIFDTRGTQTELINSLTNTLLFKSGGKFTFVIVVQISSILDRRGGMLADICLRIYQLFGKDFNSVCESTCLVVSKTNPEFHTQTDILQQLTQLLQNANTSFKKGTPQYYLLHHLVITKKICLFPNPDKITKKQLNIIQKNIGMMKICTLKYNSCVSLSEQCKYILAKEIENARSRVRFQADKISQFIRNKFDNQYYYSISAAQRNLVVLFSAMSLNYQFQQGMTPVYELQKVLAFGRNNSQNIVNMLINLQNLQKLMNHEQHSHKNYFYHKHNHLFTSVFTTIDHSINKLNYIIQQMKAKQQRQQFQRMQKAEEQRRKKQLQEYLRKQYQQMQRQYEQERRRKKKAEKRRRRQLREMEEEMQREKKRQAKQKQRLRRQMRKKEESDDQEEQQEQEEYEQKQQEDEEQEEEEQSARSTNFNIQEHIGDMVFGPIGGIGLGIIKGIKKMNWFD